MLKRSIFLLGLLVSGLTFAHGGVDAARRSVEASMLVTGEIAVNPDGSVYGFSLDHRDRLPAPVVKLIDGLLPRWEFTPVEVDGKAALAKASMSLRVVAKRIDAEHDAISIESAAFGNDVAASHDLCAPGACLTYRIRGTPIYPLTLLQNGVSGTVYLVVEVNRQGRVAQVAVRQVDLRKLADATLLARWRRELGQASLNAARGWTFNIPTAGAEAKQDSWYVVVPINFLSAGSVMPPSSGYGQWDVYVSGPVHSIPWAQTQHGQVASNGGADAVPDNGMPFVADARFVLLTPIGGDGKAQTGAAPGQG